MYKKLLPFIFLIALLLFVSSVYLFIPSGLTVSSYTVMRTNVSGAFRVISEDTVWGKLQEGREESRQYHISGKFYNAIALKRGGTGEGGHETMTGGRVMIRPLSTLDSIALQWNWTVMTSWNPVKRIRQYVEVRNIKNDMVSLMSSLKLYLEKKENIYGMNIVNAMSQDSTLIATRIFLPSYPSTAEIYGMVAMLRKYIASQGAAETNHPMLHVWKNREGINCFEAMVAIPVNRRLKGDTRIFLKLFVPYKILMGSVNGGAFTAEHALEQLEQYRRDYQQTPMAIPFQSLVTERDREPDTAKWVTRVILPID